MQEQIHRILYDKYIIELGNTRYLVKSPDRDLYYKSNEYYLFLCEKNKFNIFITENTLLEFMRINKLWTQEENLELAKVDKEIEDLKVEMYDQFILAGKIGELESRLNKKKRQRDKLYIKRHSLDHITLEGYCRVVSNNYILLRTVKNLKTKKYLHESNIDSKEFLSIVGAIKDNALGESDYRRLARNSYWRGFWNIGKEKVFGKEILDLSEEQRHLINYTKMYDNIASHSECPPDEIINNDNLLDGWMIKLNRKGEANKSRKQIEAKLTNKAKSGNEVFVVASPEKAKDVYNINTDKGKAIIDYREKLRKQKNIVDYTKIVEVNK